MTLEELEHWIWEVMSSILQEFQTKSIHAVPRMLVKLVANAGTLIKF